MNFIKFKEEIFNKNHETAIDCELLNIMKLLRKGKLVITKEMPSL